jgi:hypothetical protein
MFQKIFSETFDCFRKRSNLSEENLSEEVQMFQKKSKCFSRIEFLLHVCTGLYADATHMFQKKHECFRRNVNLSEEIVSEEIVSENSRMFQKNSSERFECFRRMPASQY